MKEKEGDYKRMEGNDLEVELRRERESLHQYQMGVDRLRIKMIEITKEESNIRESISDKRKYYGEIKSNLEKEHKL